MKKTLCFKLYKSKKNKCLHKKIDLGSQIYNYSIALHKRFYRLYKKYLNKYKLQKHLTKTKKRKLHFKNLESQAIQDITDRIDRSYKLFFRNCLRESSFFQRGDDSKPSSNIIFDEN